MMNSDYNILKDWMFGKLTSLLQNTEPNPKYPVLKTIDGGIVSQYEKTIFIREKNIDILNWFLKIFFCLFKIILNKTPKSKINKNDNK